MDVVLQARLHEYNEKRNFEVTEEPKGSTQDAVKRIEELKKGARPIFVVQKHHASRLHYDFRLEIGGF